MALMEIEGAEKEFAVPDGSVLALTDINLTVSEGTILSIVGPSGCGKSTLLMMIAGLETPTGGVVRIGGRSIRGPHTELGVVFQRDLLLNWRTTIDNVLLQFELRGIAREPYRQKAIELLTLVGLQDYLDRYPRQLSGGMRQRVAICRALVHDPPVLLMDEPFGALDALTREQLNIDLARICEATRKTVLFVTHSVDEAVFLGDRVISMSPRPGRIIDDFKLDLPRPRRSSVRDSKEYGDYVQRLRANLMSAGVLRE